ncbi:MAG: hypothetical protein ACD_3C00141G0002 [uncultured bacterium (gcode 4)]|uniref:Uncharacterized protein n=1 Tax=uncultured bacterium (gcode 4) TaxID=1234023 RepID=K2GWX4_9BACT|nr:MAG: hypothetical protein ACD_3C00141G0002 [uncultured bacterium (gcode 4)]
MSNTKNKLFQRKSYEKLSAFTLVELIVVIVILAILATIAFLSFSSHSVSARDSTRLSDMSNISKWLSVFKATAWTYPKPDSNVPITLSGTVIWYQWYAWASVLNMVKMSNGWKDPLDTSTYYTYSTDSAQTKFQLLGFLEDGNNATVSLNPIWGWDANALDYKNRFIVTRGDALGILLQSWSMIPVQEAWLQVELNNNNTYAVSFSSNEKVTMSWSSLQQLQISYINWAWLTWSPKSCPQWFIPVNGNAEFKQAGFCVAKYEMKANWWEPWHFSWSSTFISTWTDMCNWNSLCWNWDWLVEQIDFPAEWRIQSSANWFPITYVLQEAAIQACKNLWNWYHLINNNEWMTIARDIENQSVNWNSWIIGSWGVYKWVTNSLVDPLWFKSLHRVSEWTYDEINLSTPREDNARRQLKLSNWFIIHDFSWNVWEHVNKANNISWEWFNSWTTSIWTSSGWLTWTGITINSEEKKNYYSANLSYEWGWLWNIHYPLWVENDIFLRWWWAWSDYNAWIYALTLAWDKISDNLWAPNRTFVWFRCAR